MLDRAGACVRGRAVFFFRWVGAFFREPACPRGIVGGGGGFGTSSLHVNILVSILIEYLMLSSTSFRFNRQRPVLRRGLAAVGAAAGPAARVAAGLTAGPALGPAAGAAVGAAAGAAARDAARVAAGAAAGPTAGPALGPALGPAARAAVVAAAGAAARQPRQRRATQRQRLQRDKLWAF